MSVGLGDIEVRSLPREIPIFPLTGALLLPRASLPLTIFEPRYLTMVTDALAQPLRLIGMVQPKGAPAHPVPDAAPLYDVGCAGRITAFQESDDGRFAVTLSGLIRFRIEDDRLSPGGYRVARVDMASFADDLAEDDGRIADRARLLDTLGAYFRQQRIEADWSAIADAPDQAIVTSLAMICPFEPREKQMLLETDGIERRGELLTTLMEIALHGDDRAAGDTRH